MFRIELISNISLAQIMELVAAGVSVAKTPHVGNVYLANLVVAQLGIPLRLVDTNLGGRDELFHPHRIIAGGAHEEIADPNVFSTHARVMQQPLLFADRFVLGSRVLDAHVQALRDAVPGVKCETWGEYVRRNEKIARAVLKALGHSWNHQWERFVSTSGVPEKRVSGFYPGAHVFGLDSLEEGWVIPNIVAILVDQVIEARLTGQCDIYHLSGPQMVTYINSYGADLSRMYDQVRAALSSWNLPETLTLKLVPAADLRLAVPIQHRAALDELVNAHLEIPQREHERARVIKAACNTVERQSLISAAHPERALDKQRLKNAVANCPGVFNDPKDKASITQYDLLSGVELYVHPWMLEATVGEVAAAVKLFRSQQN